MTSFGKGRNSTAIHAGFDPMDHKGAVSVPIYQSSTFMFPSAEEGAARFDGRSDGPIYTRLGNPTTQALESCVAALEGGCGAIGTATGMAAVATVLLTLLKPGDHVVATDPLYGASRGLLEARMGRFGVVTTWVPARDPAALRAAMRPTTRMIFVETPANPTLDLVDLEAAAAAAREAGVPLVVDNTFAGPAPAAPARARRRRRPPLDDEVAQRSRRRGGRRRGREGPCRAEGAPRDGVGLRHHDGSAPGVARASRHSHARDARRACPVERGQPRRVARGAPGGGLGALPGPAVPSTARARRSPDGRPRLGHRLRAEGRSRGRTAAHRLGAHDHARRLARAASSR